MKKLGGIDFEIGRNFSNELLKCDKCGTLKEQVIEIDGKKRVVACLCECEKAEAEQNKKREEAFLIKSRRDKAFCVNEHKKRTFKTADNKNIEVKNKLINYCNKIDERLIDGIGVLMYGGYGTGKTYFAHCIINNLIDKGIKCRCTSMVDVVTNAQKFDTYDRWYNEMLTASVIMIDDFGAQRTTGFAWEKVYQFINDCIELKRVMIITTNMTIAELEQRAKSADIDEGRIYSRVLGSCAKILVNGADRRLQNNLGGVF